MYCATKAFLISFTESLHLKLKKYNIKLQALCPGFTHTDFHERIGYDKNDPIFKSFMTSEDVVKTSLKYLDKGKVICIPGFNYRLGKLIVSLLPREIFYKSVLFYSKFNKRNKN
jgi:short-subunit dehydrogenase